MNATCLFTLLLLMGSVAPVWSAARTIPVSEATQECLDCHATFHPGIVATEIMPGSVVGGIDGYLRLCCDLGPDAPGFNFDTGHAWAAGEDILRIPERLGKQILGTHLCDNFGHENRSLRPGAGSIDWPQLAGALMAAHYSGAWDIEIICPPERCREEYGQAYHFMTSQIQPATAPLPAR